MQQVAFGKRHGLQSSPPPNRRSASSAVDMGRNFPWRGDDEDTACNLATGDLVTHLPALLTGDFAGHAETLVAAFGAVAGFAAQVALLTSTASRDKSLHNDLSIIVPPMGGDWFFFGERLNRAVYPQTKAEAQLKLWSLATQGARLAGLPDAIVPTLQPMFAYVNRMICSERDFYPSTPDHRPRLPGRELLKLCWPLASESFDGRKSGRALSRAAPIAQRWRPAIAATAAKTAIQSVRNVLDPRIALTITMESAIYASRLYPVSIER